MRWRGYRNGPVLAVLVAVVMVIGSLVWSPDPGAPPPVPPREPSPFEDSSDAKRQIARRLAAREVPLLTAAAAIREVDCLSPHFKWDEFRRAYPDAGDDERHCRETVEWFLAVSPDDDATAERVRELNDEIDRRVCERDFRRP